MTNPNIEPQLCVQGNEFDLYNIDGNFVAQRKFDGHRAIMFRLNGVNHFYSRRTSDVTGEKEENTDRLPYLSSLNILCDNTILDGELVLEGDTDSAKVQQILGSTPERAKELWDSGCHLKYIVFDVIRLNGENLDHLTLRERLPLLAIVKKLVKDCPFIEVASYFYDSNSLHLVNVENQSILDYVTDYKKALENSYSDGYEGIVLKDINSKYEFKRNTKWRKFKKVLTADLVIIGYVQPKKEYTGKFSLEELRERGWEYWDGDKPVSKTWAKGWVAGIVCGAYKDGELKKVCIAKGFSDEIQELIKNKQLGTNVLEVAFQEVINQDTKSLRHPRIKCFRYDKKEEDCLWENI